MTDTRNFSLDGLRGVAAISVACYHFCCAFTPVLVPEYSSPSAIVADTPLALLYNGGFAVAVFFVLSGYVIAGSGLHSRRPIGVTLFRRYLRLALPALASTALAWILLASWPSPRLELAIAIDSAWLDYVYKEDLPGPLSALYSGLVSIFFEGGSFFNNALWTLKIELIGSCAIYLLCIIRHARLRQAGLVILLAVTVALGKPEYGAFAFGALLQEVETARVRHSRFAWTALCFGLLFGAMMPGVAQRVALLQPLEQLPSTFRLGEPCGFWHVAAATAVVYAVLNLPAISRPLASSANRFLGRISFGLYLVHVPLIYTLFAALYLALPADAGYRLLLFLIYVPVIVGAGYVLTVAVDQPTIRLLKRFDPRSPDSSRRWLLRRSR